jgi:hypothetical protein
VRAEDRELAAEESSLDRQLAALGE